MQLVHRFQLICLFVLRLTASNYLLLSLEVFAFPAAVFGAVTQRTSPQTAVCEGIVGGLFLITGLPTINVKVKTYLTQIDNFESSFDIHKQAIKINFFVISFALNLPI